MILVVCHVQTMRFFAAEGMDYFDHEGSLAEMGSLLAQGRLEWKDKARFYFRVSRQTKIDKKANLVVTVK